MKENYIRIKANTHDHFEQLQKQLLADGYDLFTIEGMLMKYSKSVGAKTYRADIYMSFWQQ